MHNRHRCILIRHYRALVQETPLDWLTEEFCCYRVLETPLDWLTEEFCCYRKMATSSSIMRKSTHTEGQQMVFRLRLERCLQELNHSHPTLNQCTNLPSVQTRCRL